MITDSALDSYMLSIGVYPHLGFSDYGVKPAHVVELVLNTYSPKIPYFYLLSPQLYQPLFSKPRRIIFIPFFQLNFNSMENKDLSLIL